MLIDPILPASGVTFLHGPPGAGKSAILWSIGQAVQEGSPWFGIPAVQRGVMLLSNDMNQYQLNQRWGSFYSPTFLVSVMEEQDICNPAFRKTKDFSEVQNLIAWYDIGLVLIDASGGLHLGRSNKDDETAEMVYHALKLWLGPIAVVLLHHDRKGRVLSDGSMAEPTPEDFLGSNRWRSKAVSQLHAYQSGNQKSTLTHDKSQVSVLHPDKFQVYINLAGGAEPWSDKRASEVAQKWHSGVRSLRIGSLPLSEQVVEVAKLYGITERTAWRWNKLASQ